MNDQRGLSGRLRRTRKTTTPRIAPTPKANRQPVFAGNTDVSKRTSAPAEPAAAPSQYVPLITKSTRPRTLAGMNSSIAALVAAYSAPIAEPLKKRARKKYHGANAKAVATVESR